jgi:ABC-2 type transport system permease protein
VSAEARVYDIRFGRYDGVRRGRAAAIWSLARWSSLRALGARRGWKAKLVPISLTLVAFAPAVIVLGLRALFASRIDANLADALPYVDYGTMISLVIMVFAVVITPEMLCPDRRDRTLTLYFSTAIGPLDYVIGKLLAAVLPLLLVTTAPPLVLFVGNVLFSVHPLGYLQDHAGDIPRIVGSGLLIACFFALVGLAVASLTSRRALAVGGYLGLLIVPAVVGGILSDALDGAERLQLLALPALPVHAARALFPGGLEGEPLGASDWLGACAAAMAIALAVLAWRYREVEP